MPITRFDVEDVTLIWESVDGTEYRQPLSDIAEAGAMVCPDEDADDFDEIMTLKAVEL